MLDPEGLDPCSIEQLADDPEQREVVIEGGAGELDRIELGRIEQVDVEASVLVATSLSDAHLQARFDGVDLVGCDVANADLSASWWFDVLATDCRMTGMTLAKADLRRVSFDRCAMSLASFRGAKLEQVSFLGCDLAGVDFTDATLVDVRIDDCDLDGFLARGSTLERVDLSRSTLGSAVEVSSLRGATIDGDQLLVLALQLAQRNGIEVADDTDR